MIFEPKESFFTPIKICTMSISNKVDFTFQDSSILDKLNANNGIPVIKSNQGIKIHIPYIVNHLKFIRKIIERFCKTIKTKKKHGNGSCMNSSLSFYLNADDTIKDKIYNIKLFANGYYQITGVIDPDITKIQPYIDKFLSVLSSISDKPVLNVFPKYNVDMQNFKFKINKPDILFKLSKLSEVFQKHKLGLLDCSCNLICNSIGWVIYLVIFGIESSLLDIKFHNPNNNLEIPKKKTDNKEERPVKSKKPKTISIAISKNMKINLQGGISDFSVNSGIMEYIKTILYTHFNLFIVQN